ncbi:MAG: hypothetical protein P0Y59_21665 [Candidatus Sphingomonas phytovorans]|nr:hypothetical protein [Sphingomonas sp.]WEJ99489.1 MAG: hypothetical protein P0Y59_21665 [Sphingomonas sp.]
MQALFDVFREIAGTMLGTGDMTKNAFVAALQPAAAVDFANAHFNDASGSNRTRIRRIIRARLGLIGVDDLPDADKQFV